MGKVPDPGFVHIKEALYASFIRLRSLLVLFFFYKLRPQEKRDLPAQGISFARHRAGLQTSCSSLAVFSSLLIPRLDSC